jgi:hypothetical protein
MRIIKQITAKILMTRWSVNVAHMDLKYSSQITWREDTTYKTRVYTEHLYGDLK